MTPEVLNITDNSLIHDLKKGDKLFVTSYQTFRGDKWVNGFVNERLVSIPVFYTDYKE